MRGIGPRKGFDSLLLFGFQFVAHAVLLSMFFWASWYSWLFTLLGYFCFACLGTGIGYHRLFAHRSFYPSAWFERMCLALGNMALVGSSISWTASHRAHHHHSDQSPADTHSPHHHPWYRVILLAMFQPVSMRYVKDLARTHAHVWWHKNYFLVHGAVWGLGLLLAPQFTAAVVIAPQALTWIMGASLNWANHKWGYRNHNTCDHSTNNWFYALVFWGEGWHNNHHHDPKKSYFGERWWELDVGGWIIKKIIKQ